MSKKCAIYCTADDAYIIPSIIALKSIKRFHPESSYFVIADKNRISAKHVALLSDFGMNLIHFGEDHLFPNIRPWTMETFWKYKGPEIFLGLGFAHSMYVDGDILCVQSLDLPNLLPQIDGYAGIENLGPRKRNFEDPYWIQRKYGLSEENLNGHNTNAGVIFWNNKNVVELKLFERLVQCFQECSSENARMFRAVDQSLFALVSVLDPVLPWFILPRGYNYRVHNASDQKEDITEKDIRVYHFTGPKPWKPVELKDGLRNPSLLLHRDKWFAFVDELGVFKRNLTIKNRGVVERIGTSVRYSFDDWTTAIIIKSPVVSLTSTFVALARKIKRGSRKVKAGLFIKL